MRSISSKGLVYGDYKLNPLHIQLFSRNIVNIYICILCDSLTQKWCCRNLLSRKIYTINSMDIDDLVMLRSQGISNHVIGLICTEYTVIYTERVKLVLYFLLVGDGNFCNIPVPTTCNSISAGMQVIVAGFNSLHAKFFSRNINMYYSFYHSSTLTWLR